MEKKDIDILFNKLTREYKFHNYDSYSRIRRAEKLPSFNEVIEELKTVNQTNLEEYLIKKMIDEEKSIIDEKMVAYVIFRNLFQEENQKINSMIQKEELRAYIKERFYRSTIMDYRFFLIKSYYSKEKTLESEKKTKI